MSVSSQSSKRPSRATASAAFASVDESRASSATKQLVRSTAVLTSHAAVDAYAALVPASLVILATRCGLSDAESAWMLGIGPLVSGVSQPFAAWISDRFDSRLFVGLGLAVCAIGTCLLGWAGGFLLLAAIYLPTMLAAGAYHPVAAATAGQLGGKRRSLAASLFFISGMIGGALGAYFFPRLLSTSAGFRQLPYWMIPGVAVAIVTHLAVAGFPHRTVLPAASRPSRREDLARWGMVGLLYLSSAIRFSVNIVLLLLFSRWAELQVTTANPDWSAIQVANQAGPMVGNLISAMMMGMGLGGVLAAVVPAGSEKRPLIWVPIVLAPSIWFLPHLSAPWVYVAAAVAGIGFASMVPVGMVVSQRLLPHHTSMASGLMLGGAWAVSAIGPRLAQAGVAEWGLVPTFQATAVALVLSGIITIPLKSQLIRRSV